jgi:hypothetical protein
MGSRAGSAAGRPFHRRGTGGNLKRGAAAANDSDRVEAAAARGSRDPGKGHRSLAPVGRAAIKQSGAGSLGPAWAGRAGAARQTQWPEGLGQGEEENGAMPRLGQAATVAVLRANQPGLRQSGAAGAARPSCQVFLHKHRLSTLVGRRVGSAEPQLDSGLAAQ